MKNVRPDFEESEGTASNIDTAYQKVTCHRIFDVKMLDSDGLFKRKARYVAGVILQKLQLPSTTRMPYHDIRFGKLQALNLDQT